MAKVVVNNENLTAIAAAIREKNGETTTYKPNEMAAAITALSTGELETIPQIALGNIYTNDYRFYMNNWNWFIENYGDQIDVPIKVGKYSFYSSQLLENIPFQLVFEANDMEGAFYGCSELKEITNCATPEPYKGAFSAQDLFYGCINLRSVPSNIFGEEIYSGSAYPYSSTTDSSTLNRRGSMFNECYSLRELPNLKTMITATTSTTRTLYYSMAYNCYSLNEIVNLPVAETAVYTSNAFGNICYSTYRLKNFTFEAGKTANWSNQTIDLSNYVGYSGNASRITSYNSGITTATRISNDADYIVLKDDPDSWTSDVIYSRYNRISAIATINSLPDCSAGTGNTIKFLGRAGSGTDGRAINTLTEEQIAVAASKGWTVSLV